MRMGASELVQTTYAGNRASDGGLIRVRDVVARKPDACIFEPLVEDPNRGSNASRAEILHVYSSLADAGILPIALFLPDPVHRSPKIWPAYPMHREICDEAGIPVEEAKRRMVTEKQAMARFTTPEQIGATAVFLCSDGASTITGASISVDGGWVAQ